MVFTYAGAPVAPLWTPPAWTRWVPVLAMPVALLLAVCAFTTSNVTAVGGENQSAAPDPTTGIMRITRHPFLIGAELRTATHPLATGEAAPIVHPVNSSVKPRVCKEGNN